ncbi:tadE-like family protein [Collimonas arenae]|uniref:TadE-like family protein n=2 Tax=Collimonas arenae TaxID=279058 RepID=A0A127PLT9_9BURK|nr:TadE family protein [Collimonas arenae]AMO98749.1 tadE-like family protein [Collimonas arenae]AMP08642.1 tadE-like family protein [Collimonas arenae]
MYKKYKCMAHPDVAAASGCRKQRGVAAIEFALIFPVFFMLLYGIITYVLIFLAQQSLALAAEEGARAALRYTSATDPNQRGVVGCNVAKGLVSWLGKDSKNNSIATCSFPTPAPCTLPGGASAFPAGVTSQCITIKVFYPYSSNPLVPRLLGPVMNVALPTTLASAATVQID